MVIFRDNSLDIYGDFINCLEVGIWEDQLLSGDGLQLHWNAINVDVIVKGVSIEISSAALHKNVK